MDAEINVERLDVMDFCVTLIDDAGPSQHTVIATQEDHAEYAPEAPLEELVGETFRYLLERGPHSMIQDHFSLKDVARMYIDYEFEMKRRFAA